MKAPLFLLTLLLVATSATAQRTDTLRTETTTEDARISAAEVKRFIRYITRADVEEKTLVKVGIWPTTDRTQFLEHSKFRIGGNFEVSVEQKISPSLSVLIGIDGFWQYAKYQKSISIPGTRPVNAPDVYRLNYYQRFETNAKVGLRYYYSKHNRIKSGGGANNFSGNYISFQANTPWMNTLQNSFLSVYTGEEVIGKLRGRGIELVKSRFILAYGLQRRLGKFSYFDVNAGPEVFKGYNDKPSFSFQLNALIGFGW